MGKALYGILFDSVGNGSFLLKMKMDKKHGRYKILKVLESDCENITQFLNIGRRLYRTLPGFMIERQKTLLIEDISSVYTDIESAEIAYFLLENTP